VLKLDCSKCELCSSVNNYVGIIQVVARLSCFTLGSVIFSRLVSLLLVVEAFKKEPKAPLFQIGRG